jgi:hypothetical protein
MDQTADYFAPRSEQGTLYGNATKHLPEPPCVLPAEKITGAFEVGQWVRVRMRYGTISRRDKIASIGTSSRGMTIYILRDGGMFSANELEAAP